MAGYSMFEHCLAADIRDSLRGGTDDRHGRKLARLVISVDANDREKPDTASSDKYWLSGDHLAGEVSIERSRLMAVTRAQIRFEGRHATSPNFRV